MNELISQLRGVHIPPTPSIWPLAPGWFILAFSIILIGLIVILWFVKRWRKNKPKRIALKELKVIEKNLSDKQNLFVISDLSILLKRVALAYFPRQEISGLAGGLWLKFLDKSGQTQEFTQGIGRVLLSAPYQKSVHKDNKEILLLIKLIRSWINKR